LKPTGAYTENSFKINNSIKKTNLKVATAFGMAKIVLFKKDGKTHYNIMIYKIPAGQMPFPFPKGFPKDFQKNLPKDFPKDFPPMPIPPPMPQHTH